MDVKELFIKEWERESQNTLKMLERIPEDKLSWKPHEKSKSLGALALHVAALPARWSHIIDSDNLDPSMFKQPEFKDKNDIIRTFQESSTILLDKLKNADPSEYDKQFTFSQNGKVLFTMSKGMGIIVFFGHLIHHRAQLSVYLRLLNVPVPGMYGPTADE